MFGATTIQQNFHIFSNYNNHSNSNTAMNNGYMSGHSSDSYSNISDNTYDGNVYATNASNTNNQYYNNNQYNNNINNNNQYNSNINNNNQYNNNNINNSSKYYNYNNQYYSHVPQHFPFNNSIYPPPPRPPQQQQMFLSHHQEYMQGPTQENLSHYPQLIPPPPQPQQHYPSFGQPPPLHFSNNMPFQYNSNNSVPQPSQQQQFVHGLPPQYQFDNSMLYAPVISRPMYNVPEATSLDINRGYESGTMARFIIAYSFDLLFGYVPNNISDSFEQRLVSVLNATRLSKSSVLLGMSYLIRKKRSCNLLLNTQSEVYLHIIISLILGNKYNDDNTFTNRSWSNATGISLEQLNTAEREWLLSSQFDLHLDPQGVQQESLPPPIEEDVTKPWLTSLADLTCYNINPYTVINTDPAYGAFQKYTANTNSGITGGRSECYYSTVESLFNSFEMPTISNANVTSPISAQFNNAIVSNNNNNNYEVSNKNNSSNILATKPVRHGSYSAGGGSMLYQYSSSPIITPKSPSLNDYYYYDSDLVGRGNSISVSSNANSSNIGGDTVPSYLMKTGYNHLSTNNISSANGADAGDYYRYPHSLPGSSSNSTNGYYNDNFQTYKHLDHADPHHCCPCLKENQLHSDMPWILPAQYM